ncbi:MAG: hypothetical protein ACPKPY_05565 [Nitrososphaeraceae archaeon]
MSDNSEKGILHYDTSYCLLFDSNDKTKIDTLYRRIRSTSNNYNLLDSYETTLGRIYNDQTVSFDTVPEPLEIGWKNDRVVFSGLERIAQLVTGKSSQVFRYYALGVDDTPVLPSDTTLGFEQTRSDIFRDGFAESKGSSIVFATAFPSTLATNTFTESGIFDSGVAGTMLLRTVYDSNNVIHHTSNNTFPAVSHFIYQLSV